MNAYVAQARWTTSQAEAMPEPDPLEQLLTQVERIDALLQLQLQLQQVRERSDDKHNMQQMLQEPQQLQQQLWQPCGYPGWMGMALADQDTALVSSQRAAPLLQAMPAPHSRLHQLCQRFALDPVERDLLLLSALPLIDTRYGTMLAYLQDDPGRPWPSVGMACAMLLDEPLPRLQAQARLASGGALMRHGLVHAVPGKKGAAEQGAGLNLRIDTAVYQYLLGQDALAPELLRHARWEAPPMVAERHAQWSAALVEMLLDVEHSAVLLLRGMTGSGRAAAIATAASQAGMRTLVIDLAALPSDEEEALLILRQGLHVAALHGACVVLRELAALCEQRKALWAELQVQAERHALRLVAVLDDHDPVTWLGRRAHLQIDMPARSLAADEFMLRQHLMKTVGPVDVDLARLVQRFRPHAQDLDQVLAEAQLHCRQRGAGGKLEEQDLYAAFRLRAQQSFGKLAQRVEPRRSLDDLIVSDNLRLQLDELLAAIRQRDALLEQGFARKLSYGFGVSALFHGDSGTGKTMVAEVLARTLGVDLIKVDLSTVVNKYIGETEKNLARIFDLAAADAGVLFFDEADALFGKRSETKDAQDRHANIEVSYLLQRLENYPGLVILSTNNRSHLDTAFNRRLTFIIKFSFPDAGLRERMWRAIWPEQVALAPGIDFGALARRAEITGANIRNVALLASWLAADQEVPVAMRHIELALNRELSKLGRIPT